MDASPVYRKVTTTKSTVSCPVFVKSPVSSASLFGYQWISRWPLNLSTALFGTAQMLYALLLNIFLTSSTSGIHICRNGTLQTAINTIEFNSETINKKMKFNTA